MFTCPTCQGTAEYQSFSGGKEAYCPSCKNQFYIDDTEVEPGSNLDLLRQGEYDTLRTRMHEYLDDHSQNCGS